MARTITEIKKSMTDQFMSEPVIREKYGLSEGDTFDGSFSQVSIESILFGIVASVIYLLETMFDNLKGEVDKQIATAIVASVPWYHKIALAYQHGDSLVLDEKTMEYVYDNIDTEKQVVKYAACRDMDGYIYLLVAGEDESGRPKALTSNILTAFKSYMNSRKPAGIFLDVFSYDPDIIKISMQVEYDPMLLNQDGSLVSDNSVFPVEEATREYLHGIEYGGVFNKTKLVDAVQRATGVKDVILTKAEAKAADSDSFSVIDGNNYSSKGGSLTPADANMISYVLKI